MFVTLAQSQIVTDFTMIFEKLGTPGLLALAVWYVTKEVKTLYDGRIKALEVASQKCEEDRIALRALIIEKLGGDKS
jgi:hypothetical protein